MKKIIAFLTSVIVFISLIGCGAFGANTADSSQNETSSSSMDEIQSLQSSSEEQLEIGGDVDIGPTIKELYSLTQNSSMLFVEWIDVKEGFYSDGADMDFIIVECKVIKDYYCNRETGMIIHIPILLQEIGNESIKIENSEKDGEEIDSVGNVGTQRIDKNVVAEFVKQYKKAVIFVNNVQEFNSFYEKGDYNNRVSFANVSNWIVLYRDFMPIDEDNIVQHDEVIKLLDDNGCEYWHPCDGVYDFPNFLYADMSFEELEKNIEALRESNRK